MLRRDVARANNQFRDHYHAYLAWLHQTDEKSIERKREEADLLFHRVGITFNVYGDGDGAERLIPSDSIPASSPPREWQHLDKGIRQRVTALNAFLHDIYHDQRIPEGGVIPAAQILTNAQYQPCMQGVDLHRNTYVHITGSTSSATTTVTTTCWRTTCAPPGSPTCWRTAR